MRLYWQGTDITAEAPVSAATYRDRAGGKSDCLEITMMDKAKWMRWRPEEGDEIEITEGEWGTGKMYLNAICPTADHFRVLATSVPGGAGIPGWRTYEGKTLREIAENEAAECGMKAEFYGTGGEIDEPTLIKDGESPAGFLNRIARMEGIMCKACGGMFRMIDLTWAEEREARRSYLIGAEQPGVKWTRQKKKKIGFVTIQSPWARATAWDPGAEGRPGETIALGARSDIQAGRWARGILKAKNREAEEMTIEIQMDTGVSAMERIDIGGGTEMDGAWMAEEVTHDLIEKKTEIRMRRAIYGIR